MANPKAMAAIRRDQSGKGKHLPLNVLGETQTCRPQFDGH